MWQGAAIMVVIAIGAANIPVVAQGGQTPEVRAAAPAVSVESSEAREARTATPCDPFSEKRTSDLCAQWKAADAAQMSAVAAVIATLISAITLLAVFWGFRQSEQVRRQEFRAYVRVSTKVVIDAITGDTLVQIISENYGRTPAEDLIVSPQIDIVPPGEAWAGRSNPAIPSRPISKASLHMGCTMNSFFPLLLKGTSPEKIERIKRGEEIISFRCTAFYKDVFGDSHRTSFSIRYHYGLTGLEPMLTPDGNWSD